MAITKRDLIDQLKNIEGVERVALLSRTGMFIEGDEFGDLDTFSAMSAIILGAAETASTGVGEVKKVIVHFQEGRVLVITSAGKRGVLVVLANRDVYDKIESIKEGFRAFI